MNATPLFRGVGVALVTLFDEDRRLAAGATAELAAQLVDLGVRAVLVAGTTGEAAALEAGERVALLDAVRAAVPERVPVIAGTGAPSTGQAVALTTQACDHGADAVLVLSPPRVADPRPYYDAVAKVTGPTPLLAYHFPTASAPGISVEDLAELPVAGCKDSSGDAERLLRTLARFSGDLWVGSPILALLAGVTGAAGAVLAVANFAPESCLAAWGGDVAAQQEIVELQRGVSSRFPDNLKASVAARFGTSVAARQG